MKETPVDPALIDDPWLFGPGVEDPGGLDWNTIELIKDAVEDLPEIERAVMECLFWGQMTKVETAAALGITRQTVHDAERRAKPKLQKALENLL